MKKLYDRPNFLDPGHSSGHDEWFARVCHGREEWQVGEIGRRNLVSLNAEGIERTEAADVPGCAQVSDAPLSAIVLQSAMVFRRQFEPPQQIKCVLN